jgi:hypothetical protein
METRIVNHSFPSNGNLRTQLARILFISASLAATATVMAQGWQVGKTLKLQADLGLKETYDSNVYIQDTAPDPANVAAAQAAGFDPVEANKESFVTAILPRVGLDYQPCAAFRLAVAYAPEIAFYHSADSEDYVAHRGTLNLSGTIEDTKWELLNTFTGIDGSSLGPTFARPGDVPAIGGIPLRNRRDAFIFQNSFRVTQPLGKFLIRPIATAYLHDFGTKQFSSGPGYVYENYIDRQNINGGLDVGIPLGRQTHFIVGYRYGDQQQFKLLGADSPYDRTYHRVLVGLEGSPVKWLKLALLGGPDFNDYASGTPASFHDDELIYFMDSSITLLPTSKDTIRLSNTRYQQPAFSSFSVYEDITYAVTWKHTFDSHWSANAGFQLYIGDWQKPVSREDWIYTPSAGVTYTHDKHLSVDFGYSYDWVENHAGTSTPQTQYADGREYTRHLVWLAAKYAF